MAITHTTSQDQGKRFMQYEGNITTSLDDLGGISTMVLTSSPHDSTLLFSSIGTSATTQTMPNLNIKSKVAAGAPEVAAVAPEPDRTPKLAGPASRRGETMPWWPWPSRLWRIGRKCQQLLQQ